MFIKADRDYMTNILDKLTSGELLIPEFQRDFVWEKRQMIDLFDSIVKGFPIGSIILWSPQTDDFDSFKTIGGIEIETSSLTHCYVLDGRQRLTTLLSVLSDKGENKDLIYIDLNDFSIMGKGKSDPKLLRLCDAFDSYSIVDYIERIKGLGLDETDVKRYADRAKKINKILMSYSIGYITVNGGGIDDAVEIFSRLNSQGTTISPDFMIQALTFNSKTHFKFGDAVREIQEELEEYNFSSLKRDVILKCVANYTSKAFIDAKTEDIIHLDNLPTVMEDVKRTVVSAVKFLNRQCNVIDVKLLPYTYQLIMLALYFKENKETNNKEEELKKWFYYTSYTNYFTNTSLARIRGNILEFEKFSKGLLDSPIDYSSELSIERSWDTPISLGAVNTCCFVMSQLYIKKHTSDIQLVPFAIPQTGKKRIFNTIWCTNKSQIKRLRNVFTGKLLLTDEELKPFGLSNKMILLYKERKLADFLTERMVALTCIERNYVRNIIGSNCQVHYSMNLIDIRKLK